MVDILKYTKIETKKIPIESIVFKENIGQWCQLPYSEHKKGCPNYGKGLLCPPKSPFYRDIVKNWQCFSVVYAVIDLKGYKDEMRISHPNWSEKQLSCVLYWQRRVKVKLRSEVDKICNIGNDLVLGCGSGFGDCYSMESVGINVIQTLKNNNIEIDVKPINRVVLVSLICKNKKEERKEEK